MAIDTMEQVFAEYCARLPLLADEARRVAHAGGVYEITITARATSKRGLVMEMTAREHSKSQTFGRFIDVK